MMDDEKDNNKKRRRQTQKENRLRGTETLKGDGNTAER
jgi:hypothetical protein